MKFNYFPFKPIRRSLKLCLGTLTPSFRTRTGIGTEQYKIRTNFTPTLFPKLGFRVPKHTPKRINAISSDKIVDDDSQNSMNKQVFKRERLNGYYGVGAFIISNFLSSFPFLVLVSFATGTLTYYMVKFGHGWSHYLYFCLNILGSISVVESCMMIVASFVPNFLMGIITGAGIIVRNPTH